MAVEPQFDDSFFNPETIKDHLTELASQPQANDNQTLPPQATQTGFNIEDYRITDSTYIPIPAPTITIAGETITTSEALTVISGASKSGKSALLSILIAGSIVQDGYYDGIDDIYVKPNSEGKAVIHIDTEQARHTHQTKLKTILKRSNMTTCPDFFMSYNIGQLPIEHYSTLTNDICDLAFQKFNGIHSIWIDGGADYIVDVNDAIKANEAVKFFEDISIMYHCPIITVLHTNPGGDKERGHYGSQCQRKAEAVLTIKNEGDDISFIEAKFLRNAGIKAIPKIQFQYDKVKGYHVGIGAKTPIDRSKKKELEIQDLCNNVFSGQRSLHYDEAIEAIMGSELKGKRTAVDRFKIIKAAGLITQGADKRWRKNS